MSGFEKAKPLTIIVPIVSDAERPRRLFYSLAMSPPKTAFDVVVADDSPAGVGLRDLKLFQSSFRWTYLTPGPNHGAEFVAGSLIMVIPGFVIPVGNAIDELHASFVWPQVNGNVLDAGVTVVEGIDDFGANLSAEMVADCRECRVPVYCRKPPFWISARGHSSKATFVSLTPDKSPPCQRNNYLLAERNH